MNRPQKPTTRKLKVFKAMSRKGTEEVLVYLLRNEGASFDELKTICKDSTLRIILSLLLKAKLISTKRLKSDRRYSFYYVSDESLAITLVEMLS